MITESEKKWLERRKYLCARCFSACGGDSCGRCHWSDDLKWCAFDPKACSNENVDLLDAAEFEARVVVKAVELAAWLMQQESAWSILRDCRIEVEEEMEFDIER